MIPLDLAMIEESVVQIFGKEKIAKTGPNIYVTLGSTQRQIYLVSITIKFYDY